MPVGHLLTDQNQYNLASCNTNTCTQVDNPLTTGTSCWFFRSLEKVPFITFDTSLKEVIYQNLVISNINDANEISKQELKVLSF